MVSPKDVLSPADYANYRNVRAVSILFVLLGSVLVLGGISTATQANPNPERQIHPALAFGVAAVGLAGALGGIAALLGNRRLAVLAYVMAAVYVLVFPIGTILSYVLFTGLGRYLDSVERLRDGGVRRT